MNKVLFFHKGFALLMTLFFIPIAGYTDAGGADPDYMTNFLGNTLVIVGGLVVLTVLFSLIRFSFILLDAQKRRYYKKQGIEVPEVERQPPFFTRLYQNMTQAVPVAQEADVMLDHEYDGIRELDNSLPPWWLWMFYITIGIAVIYWGYFHYYDLGLSSREVYEQEMAEAEIIKRRFLAKQANAINESNVEVLTDADAVAIGKTIYDLNCVACHGKLGEGGVGPNLTDKYWIHGTGDIKSIFKTIKYGVPEKGMIAWQAQLRPGDMQKVASYVMTLKGTNPPNAKEPQGELVQEGQKLGMK